MPARPHVICHSMASVDGRIQSSRWGLKNAPKLFEGPAATIKVDAWIVGRTTMEEFSSKGPRRKRAGRFAIPKTDYVADKTATSFAVVIDPSGKCNWGSNSLDGEHVIEVLTEKVSGEYLDHLRASNVSYVFGGKSSIDLERALRKLHKLFGIERARIDGGGHVNGSFLRAGLIDELSLVVVPVADGSTGTPTVFDAEAGHTARMANKLRLRSVKRLPGGVVWLRYSVHN